MASERGYDESLWKLLCEQVGGRPLLVVPEELGGAGGELADAAVVLRGGSARVWWPTPLLGTTLAELALTCRRRTRC